MRHTSSHTKNRRSHHALKHRAIVKDKESGALRLPHRLDESTGMYRGKLIAPPKGRVTKVTAKKVLKKVAKKKKEESAEASAEA